MSDPGIRAAQLADQIRDCIASWLPHDLPGQLITVTGVTLSPDLRKATVWVACYTQETERVLLRRQTALTHKYQHKLGKYLRRYTVPLISFTIDRTAEDAERIEQLLK